MTTENLILDFIKKHSNASSSQIASGIDSQKSLATIKRAISKLLTQELLITTGKGKATKYSLSPSYNLLRDINIEDYYHHEIDDREIIEYFNFNLIDKLLPSVNIFSKEEMQFLETLQKKFTDNFLNLSKTEKEKEFERLAIDLSWKSSQIEGNTYSLLETEKLLKEKQTAQGKTKEEAVMLLNHKEAIDFIVENPNYLQPLTIQKIEDIHSILIQELNVDKNIRKRRVGISGTNYTPLDNEFQIKEVLQKSCNVINSKKNVFEQSLLAILLLSYIQPFVDGNKRTARIVSNALLINKKYCPISFRTVDSIEYKKAMLLFYEQNNISAFKKIFISQYEFAVKKYF